MCQVIRNALVAMWKQRWEMCRDKLREIKPEPELWIDMGKYSRRDEVVISRMRLRHTLLTRGYLMENDVPDVAPHSELCNNGLLSVKHIMVECQQLVDARQTWLKMWKHNRDPNIRELLVKNIRINEIISFLKSIRAYDLI